MAQHNIGHFYGMVNTIPSVIRDNETHKIKSVTLHILTVSSGLRKYAGGMEGNFPEYNQIMIRSGAPGMVDRLAKVRQYDIVIIKGSINTRNVPKITTCPGCMQRYNIAQSCVNSEDDGNVSSSEKKYSSGMITFVTPIELDIRNTEFGDKAKFINESQMSENEKSDSFDALIEEALGFLMERREMSNEIQLIGNLCADPVSWQNGMVTAYQLGVNRKFYLKDDDPSTSTDYPYIRSMGQQADNDIEALHEGSLVLVDGFLKIRRFKRVTVCPYCSQKKEWTDKVLEVVPYSVEYLLDYVDGNERKKIKMAQSGEEI